MEDMETTTTKKPRPGEVHRVPITPGYAYAVVVRMGSAGKVLIYCYLSPRPLAGAELTQLRPDQADAIGVVAVLPFLQPGRWPHVAVVPSWNPEAWPVPEFWHRNSTLGTYRLRSYDDRLRYVGERVAPQEEALLHPEDGLAGGELWQQQLSALAAERFDGQAGAVAS